MKKLNCLNKLKRISFFSTIFLLLVVSFSFLLSDISYANTSDNISLQGKIVRNDAGYEGLNVVNGSPSCVKVGQDDCGFRVNYYSASTGGTLYYSETFSNVEIGDYGGVFNLKLGSGSSNGGSESSLEDVLTKYSNVFLEIAFDPAGGTTFGEVFTRTALNASAYAIRSKYAEGSVADSFQFHTASGASGLTAQAGSVYYDTSESVLKVYNGSTWVDIGGAGATAWASEDISIFTYGQYMESSGVGTLSPFSLDLDDKRMSLNVDTQRGGLTVFSSYNTSGAWPLVSFKADGVNFNATILELVQDGTGNLLRGYTGSTLSFEFDNLGDLHLANNGILYFEPFASLPGSGSLTPKSGEGCMYSYGGDLYWDPVCDGSANPLVSGSGSLWTDAGTYTYLTSTTDDLVFGGSTPETSKFFFDMATGRLGIGTDTPQSALDIGGVSSSISNTTGDITIEPESGVLNILGSVNISESGSYFQDGAQVIRIAKGTEVYYANVYAGVGAGSDMQQQSAFGHNAGASSTGAMQSVFGRQAGYLNTGDSQSAFGFQSGMNNTGWALTAVGKEAGSGNEGDAASVLGYEAGRNNMGWALTAVGKEAGFANIADSVSVFGYEAGRNNTGWALTAFGDRAGFGNTGASLIALGSHAGNLNTGDNVVAIGYQAGMNNVLDNQFIVQQSHVNVTPLIQGDFSTGRLGIGTTTPSATLSVQGSITGGSDALSTANNNFTFGYSKDKINRGGGIHGFSSHVTDIVIQDDGKIIAVGRFFNYAPVTRQRIARLNSDGSLDESFDSSSGADGSVNALAIQDDGKILIAGGFTSYGGVTRERIARLNSDGSLDTTFDSSSGADSSISTIAIDGDGKILIGGQFTNYGGVTRQYIARLNSDGSLDTTFDTSSGASSLVYAVTIQDDGKILIGGWFTTYKGVTRQRIARLNSDASLDTTFDSSSGASTWVDDIKIQGDGKVVIGGNFVSYAGVTRERIARLNSDGSLDTSFDSSNGANFIVNVVAIRDTGEVLVGGEFTEVSGLIRRGIAMLDESGKLLNDFAPSISEAFDDFVYDIAVQDDQKILVAGVFTSFGGVAKNSLARFNPDGSLDTSFDIGSGANSIVQTIAIQSDGKILIGGQFTEFNGESRILIARLNSDGSLDTTFTQTGSGFTFTAYYVGNVNSITLQDDGKILVTGDFYEYNGTPRRSVARLNSDGSLDMTFEIEEYHDYDPYEFYFERLYDTVVQSDGRIVLVGELYYLVGGSWYYTGVARVNTDGSLDTSFNQGTGIDYRAYTSAVQSDGKIIIGGNFWQYDGNQSWNLARINADGSFDSSFLIEDYIDDTVYSIAIQDDGKVLVGGNFSEYNGTPRSRILRLNPDGTLDTTFNPGSGASHRVRAISVQQDEKILIGGFFMVYNQEIVNFFGRLNSNGSLSTLEQLVNETEESLLLAFGLNSFFMDSTSSNFTGLLTLKDSYTDSDGGSFRFNSGSNRIEISTDGSDWVGVGTSSRSLTLSAEYPGAVLAADGSDNTGWMVADAEGTAANSMNYYQWISTETTLQDYDVRIRYTLPSDFVSWDSNALIFYYSTESDSSANSKTDIYVYEQTSSVVDASSTDNVSSTGGDWETTTISGSSLTDCNSAGDTCIFIIRMYSRNDFYTRVGDIKINYNREL